MFNSIITQNFLTFRSFSKTSWNLLYRIPAVGTIRTIYPVNSVSVSELVDCSTSDRLKLIWSGIVANSPGWVTGRYFASAVQGSSKLLLRHEDITYSTVNDFDTGCSESVATIGCDTAGSRRGQSQRSRSREALREPLWLLQSAMLHLQPDLRYQQSGTSSMFGLVGRQRRRRNLGILYHYLRSYRDGY